MREPRDPGSHTDCTPHRPSRTKQNQFLQYQPLQTLQGPTSYAGTTVSTGNGSATANGGSANGIGLPPLSGSYGLGTGIDSGGFTGGGAAMAPFGMIGSSLANLPQQLMDRQFSLSPSPQDDLRANSLDQGPSVMLPQLSQLMPGMMMGGMDPNGYFSGDLNGSTNTTNLNAPMFDPSVGTGQTHTLRSDSGVTNAAADAVLRGGDEAAMPDLANLVKPNAAGQHAPLGRGGGGWGGEWAEAAWAEGQIESKTEGEVET